jgi:hypothetical protein
VTELYQAHHLYSKYIITQEKKIRNESQLISSTQNIALHFIKKIPFYDDSDTSNKEQQKQQL